VSRANRQRPVRPVVLPTRPTKGGDRRKKPG
jgi:hypothetical protein